MEEGKGKIKSKEGMEREKMKRFERGEYDKIKGKRRKREM